MELTMSGGQILNLINLGQVDEYLDTEPELGDICKIAQALDIANVETLSLYILTRKITAAMTQRKGAAREEKRQEAVREEQRQEAVRHEQRHEVVRQEKVREEHLAVDRLKETTVGRRKLQHGLFRATPDITRAEENKGAEERDDSSTWSGASGGHDNKGWSQAQNFGDETVLGNTVGSGFMVGDGSFSSLRGGAKDPFSGLPMLPNAI